MRIVAVAEGDEEEHSGVVPDWPDNDGNRRYIRQCAKDRRHEPHITYRVHVDTPDIFVYDRRTPSGYRLEIIDNRRTG